MRPSVQITLRDNLPHPPAIEAQIEEKLDKLNQYWDKIIACHVVVELSNKKHHQGNLYNARLSIAVPGKELVSNLNEDESMHNAIRDAFDDMIRQVESYAAQMRGEGKVHQTLLSGKIIRLFETDGFGFLQGEDDVEYYFNAKHVTHPAFHHLKVGNVVHFVKAEGSEGPEAHRVRGSD